MSVTPACVTSPTVSSSLSLHTTSWSATNSLFSLWLSLAACLDNRVVFRAHNPHFILTTKCFQGVCFAWGIGGFRIVHSSHNKHAEYQVLASYGDQTWCAWVRASAFSLFAEQAHLLHWGSACSAWTKVKNEQRLFRCLEVDYLQRKSCLMEQFLKLALFESPSARPLLDFVTARCEGKHIAVLTTAAPAQ